MATARSAPHVPRARRGDCSARRGAATVAFGPGTGYETVQLVSVAGGALTPTITGCGVLGSLASVLAPFLSSAVSGQIEGRSAPTGPRR